MTMQMWAPPGLDHFEVRLDALGGAFRRISDGSSGVDRSNVAGSALVWASGRISDRSSATDPSEIHPSALQPLHEGSLAARAALWSQ
jgi:hypothetical protein